MRGGKEGEGGKEAEHARDVEPSAAECGKAAFRLGSFDTAAEYFERAIAETTSNGGRGAVGGTLAALYSNLSAARHAAGKFEAALAAADQCVAQNDAWAKAHFRRSRALLSLGDLPRARASLQAVCALDPTLDADGGEVRSVMKELEESEATAANNSTALSLNGRDGDRRRPGVPQTKPAFACDASRTVQPSETSAAAAAPAPVDDETIGVDAKREARSNVRERRPVHETPLLVSKGLSAFDTRWERGTGGGFETRKDTAVAYTHKRCRMCGNVCHVKLTSCSSCCLPLTDSASFDPADLPRPGGGVGDDSESDSDDSDGGGDGSKCLESHEISSSAVAKPPLSAQPSLLKVSSGVAQAALERRRRERRLLAQPRHDLDVVPAATDSATFTYQKKDNAHPWWQQWLGEDRLAPPTHQRGFDPSLRLAYVALGVPQGSEEDEVRAAYRRAVHRVHPDAGGSSGELQTVHAAYDALAWDAWRHEEGAAALRRELAKDAAEKTREDGSVSSSSVLPRIFVAMTVYRDPEAQHTLRSMFTQAAHPDRVYAGVVWQYKTRSRSEAVEVDRLHPEVNMLTRAVEKEAAKLKDTSEQSLYLQKMKRHQLKAQRQCDAQEVKSHGKEGVAKLGLEEETSLEPTATAWAWQENVREMHKHWRAAEGPCYAKHLAQRLWGGEEYCLHVDARTRFDRGWDENLIRELEHAERHAPRSKLSGYLGAVLTGYPLGYHMRLQPVRDNEGMGTEILGHLPVYGEDENKEAEDESDDKDDEVPTVAAVSVHSFGERLCYPAAVRLAPQKLSDSPHSALLPNPSFIFARAAALVRDCPPDPHTPFLYLGEELSIGARLWTRGYDLFLPRRCPLQVCYDPRHRRSELTEDRRSGRLLYADFFDIGRGPPDELEQRRFLNLQSQRRILQLVGAVDPDSATYDGEDVMALDGQWGLGAVRGSGDFLKYIGINFDTQEVSQRARSAGLPCGVGRWNYSSSSARDDLVAKDNQNRKYAGMSRAEAVEWGYGVIADDGLPLRWRGGTGAIDNHLVVGPPEGAEV